jgi:hypothetical protein
MRAGSLHQTDRAAGVAKCDQILAEDANRNGISVGLEQFAAQENRNPVAPEESAGRCSRTDANESFLIVASECHVTFLSRASRQNLRERVAEAA